MVATRIIFTGIHNGDLAGIAKTGKKITFEVLENFKVVNDKIVETVVLLNQKTSKMHGNYEF